MKDLDSFFIKIEGDSLSYFTSFSKKNQESCQRDLKPLALLPFSFNKMQTAQLTKRVNHLLDKCEKNRTVGGENIYYLIKSDFEAEGLVMMTVLNFMTNDTEALNVLANIINMHPNFAYKQLMRGAFEELDDDEMQRLMDELGISYGSYCECRDQAVKTYFNRRRLLIDPDVYKEFKLQKDFKRDKELAEA